MPSKSKSMDDERRPSPSLHDFVAALSKPSELSNICDDESLTSVLIDFRTIHCTIRTQSMIKTNNSYEKKHDDAMALIDFKETEIEYNNNISSIQKLINVVNKTFNVFNSTCKVVEHDPKKCHWIVNILRNNSNEQSNFSNEDLNYYIYVKISEKKELEETPQQSQEKKQESTNTHLSSSNDTSTINKGYQTDYEIMILLLYPAFNRTDDNSKISKNSKNSISNKLKDGKTHARKIFRESLLSLETETVQLEFPDFPEGNSKKRFKEIYQLNKKVS